MILEGKGKGTEMLISMHLFLQACGWGWEFPSVYPKDRHALELPLISRLGYYLLPQIAIQVLIGADRTFLKPWDHRSHLYQNKTSHLREEPISINTKSGFRTLCLTSLSSWRNTLKSLQTSTRLPFNTEPILQNYWFPQSSTKDKWGSLCSNPNTLIPKLVILHSAGTLPICSPHYCKSWCRRQEVTKTPFSTGMWMSAFCLANNLCIHHVPRKIPHCCVPLICLCLQQKGLRACHGPGNWKQEVNERRWWEVCNCRGAEETLLE